SDLVTSATLATYVTGALPGVRVPGVTGRSAGTPTGRRSGPSRGGEGPLPAHATGRRSVDDAVEAVPGVPQSRNDVGVLVEALVEDRRVDLHLASRTDGLMDGAHPLRCPARAAR